MGRNADKRQCMDDLDATGATYTTGSRQDRAIREQVVRTLKPYIPPHARALQLGYAEGVDTGLLCPLVAHLDVVEGCRAFFEAGRAAGHANVTFHLGLFEEFASTAPGGAYDCIFAVYVLEHVEDPPSLLRQLRRLLAPGGNLLAVVPNARALSRQLARHMGLIGELTDLTAHDRSHGHRRVYDRVSWNRDLESGGWQITAQGGLMLKILADFQLDKLMELGILEQPHLDGLYRLGLEYPDLCGSLFAVCAPAAEE